MTGRQLVFIGGLHRSGTSLLHEILRSHPDVSGFAGTGVPEDEGQHLQTVYLPAKAFGGPGRFGFDEASFMDERHPLATPDSAAKLFRQWSDHWDLTKEYLIEKSPPNLVRARFLQKLFPASKFIIILRHPIAVAYATRKWSRTRISSLIEHSLRCYERCREDLRFLSGVYVLRYEEFVLEPTRHIQALVEWLGMDPFDFQHEVRHNVNDKYFAMWESDRRSLWTRIIDSRAFIPERSRDLETKSNALGYSLDRPGDLLPVAWLGPHNGPREQASL